MLASSTFSIPIIPTCAQMTTVLSLSPVAVLKLLTTRTSMAGSAGRPI